MQIYLFAIERWLILSISREVIAFDDDDNGSVSTCIVMSVHSGQVHRLLPTCVCFTSVVVLVTKKEKKTDHV